jgi:hypothetical protein
MRTETDLTICLITHTKNIGIFPKASDDGYNAQDYWSSGLCPLSRILKPRKYVSERDSVS